jgi:citrate lyase subunit beta/citryl-CoA lyase
MRLRSVVIAQPGGQALANALQSEADAVAITLADAAFPVQRLREEARAAIVAIAGAGKSALVAVNHPRTRLLRDDLASIVGPGLAAVMLPHAVEPQDVRDLAVGLREFELPADVEPGAISVFAVIDTARGLLRAAEIMAAAPRVAGLVFDGMAYAHDIGAREEERGERLAYARGRVVAAARAHDGLPLVRANAFELQHLGHYGFAGALLESAAAASAANLAFTPTEAEVAHARRQIAAYAAVRGEGGWAARLGSEVVEADTVRRARQLLAQAGLED